MQVVGWREWVTLPDFGITHIRAKIDTGARTSALHTEILKRFVRGNQRWVRFLVHPFQRDSLTTVITEARLIDERIIRSSNGRTELRPIVVTNISLLGRRWNIEISLAKRDEMGYRMLLGRRALRKKFTVDPGRSYIAGVPEHLKTAHTRPRTAKLTASIRKHIADLKDGKKSTRKV